MADFDKIWSDQVADELFGAQSDVDATTKAQDAELKSMSDELQSQQGKNARTRDQAMQSAYVARKMTQRNLPQMMAAQGLTGGASETAASKMYNDYHNANNSARTDYSDANTALLNGYNQNVANTKKQYAQMLTNIRENAKARALSVAQAKYQAQMQQEELERQAQAAAARSSKGSRGKGSTTTKTPTAPASLYINTSGFDPTVANTYAKNNKLKTGYISPYLTRK
ncbi:MAG: hypothetical protein VB082_03020 [Christensenella sp.]|nr:hypothetical protein [Christensenella sp.]